MSPQVVYGSCYFIYAFIQWYFKVLCPQDFELSLCLLVHVYQDLVLKQSEESSSVTSRWKLLSLLFLSWDLTTQTSLIVSSRLITISNFQKLIKWRTHEKETSTTYYTKQFYSSFILSHHLLQNGFFNPQFISPIGFS